MGRSVNGDEVGFHLTMNLFIDKIDSKRLDLRGKVQWSLMNGQLT